MNTQTALPFVIALGIGLLIGVERERRKRQRLARPTAGVRTFAIVSLLGAVAMHLGGALLLGLAAVGLGGVLLAHARGTGRVQGQAGPATRCASRPRQGRRKPPQAATPARWSSSTRAAGERLSSSRKQMTKLRVAQASVSGMTTRPLASA